MYSNRHGLNVLLHACHLFHDACWFNKISAVSNSVCNPDIKFNNNYSVCSCRLTRLVNILQNDFKQAFYLFIY